MRNEFQYNLTHFLAYQPVFPPLAAHFLPALCCIEAEEKSPLAEGLAEIYEYSQAAKTAPEEEEPESIIKKKKSESKKNS